MIDDCQLCNLDIILTKSISRFGRDTAEVLEALNQLKILNIRVIFEQENLDTDDTDSDLMISIIESQLHRRKMNLEATILSGESSNGLIRVAQR